ncbi:hypothetical protein HY490_03510, partial [Candidatus Woesearchaeota archaeon]|nr:hypothetical protein [Candidatus Woesearchaeota archaeon]
MAGSRVFWSVFMSLLIMFMPITIAQELSIQKFSGKKGLNGVVGRDDVLELVVLASLPSTLEKGDVTPDQIRAGIDELIFLFDKCEKQGAVYKCSYNSSLEGFFGKEEYKVALFTDENEEVLRKSVTILTDSISPKIEFFTINPQVVSEGPVQFSYKAVDFAFDPGDPGTCSGLKEIQFIANGKVLQSDPADKSCRKENVFAFTKQTQSAFERTEICAKAFDVSGLVSAPVCQPLTIDKSAPSPTSVVLSDQEGFTLTHLRAGQTRLVDAIVTIAGNDDVVPDSVTADFTAIAPAFPVKRFDDVTGDRYAWRGVPVSVPGNCKVVVTAIDQIGNTAGNKELGCSLLVDDVGPTPTDIKTRAERDGKPVLGVNGTITVDFKEPGIGMKSAKTSLDLRAFGLGSPRANLCTPLGGDLWRCFWNIAPKSSGVRKVAVVETTDDLGNELTNTLELEIDVDLDPPDVNPKLKLRIQHTGGAELGNVTIVGDTVEVTATGSGIDEAVGNFTELGGGLVKTTCEGNKTLTCVFTSQVQTSGPYNATLNFDFLDLAGNFVRLNFTMPVFAIKDDPNPNYWKVDVPRCSPSLIDRSTVSVAPHPVFCQIRLSSTNKNAEPVITTLPDPSLCTGNAVTDGFVTDIGILNNGIGRKDPVIKLAVGPADVTVNQVDLNCPINIHTRVGDFFTTNPERENVSITLEFYNFPLGELAKNVDDEVEDAIKKAEALGDWIGTVDKILDLASKICTIKSTINSVVSAVDSVILTLAGLAQILTKIPLFTGLGQTAAATGSTLCTKVSGPINELYQSAVGGVTGEAPGLFSFLEKFCLFATCRLAIPETGGGGPLVRTEQVFGALGGGVPWCESAQKVLSLGTEDVLQGVTGQSIEQQVQESYQNANGVQNLADVKESLFWSTICLCVPGIFHNLNKLRQIQCKYATCVARDVKEKGIPLSFCKDSKA